MEAVAVAHPDQRIEPWVEGGMRVGLKGRTGHRRWVRGERPRGLRQRGYEWAHLFGAVRPATGEGFAPVLPEVSTAAMQVFLDRFAATLASGVHGAMVLDRAGWHGARHLAVPPNSTPVPPPPCRRPTARSIWGSAPNPVARVWLYLRERFLSHRPLDGYGAIVDACCKAWNALTPERLRSLCGYPWLARVTR